MIAENATVEALLSEAETCFGLERLDEAKGLLEQALEATGGTAEILNNLGVLAAQQGRTAEARWHLLASLEQSPENGDALINFGALEAAAGDLDLALHYLKRCLLAGREEEAAREQMQAILHERAERKERRLLIVLEDKL